MMPSHSAVELRRVVPEAETRDSPPPDPDRFRRRIGTAEPGTGEFASTLPFAAGDATAGSECELQAAVQGGLEAVDLPQTIRDSNYFKNVVRKAATGDSPRDAASGLEAFLEDNEEGVWENSWLRIPLKALGAYTRRVFEQDLRADKRCADGPARCDADRFFLRAGGELHLRLPVSYVLKLALAEAVSPPETDPMLREAAEAVMGHFLNDNTSPEITSFYTTGMEDGGRAVAGETLLRFLLSQLLVQFANRRFSLLETGQRALLYFAPTPPERQRGLNDRISDAFYRELFMSPCLSGWDCGESKHRYMVLCHEVLSRSQLNAVVKLREAGIITRNLVVLPSTSNISLANNGTHLSLGSRRITAALSADTGGRLPTEEKHWGDLAIKIVEHFLPLFVGTYSAAPYRLPFEAFHPETVLGFLPHELDFTHLRMIWRRWKKKADLQVLGRTVTPFGPVWLDRAVRRLFRLGGDWVPDFRLLDYPVALMSTEQSPALDGSPGNQNRLKQDLASMGVFDTAMPVYLLYRQRHYRDMGFSGFEGRYYSLFPSLGRDMADAAALQALVTALAYRTIFERRIRHEDIPDDPSTESERRQVFFGAAIGIPTFYVSARTRNRWMVHLLHRTRGTRNSRRYQGYVRVKNLEFRKALIRVLREDGAELIESMNLSGVIDDLERRVSEPEEASASGRLVRAIVDEAGAGSVERTPADAFNQAAERYYRTTLRRSHMEEALDRLASELERLDGWRIWREGVYNRALFSVLEGNSAAELVRKVRRDLLRETVPSQTLLRLIHLTLLVVRMNREKP